MDRKDRVKTKTITSIKIANQIIGLFFINNLILGLIYFSVTLCRQQTRLRLG